MIIDVRTPGEFAEERIDGAVNVPLDHIENGVVPDVDKAQEIIVYCRSGARSERAKDILIGHGFTAVRNGGGLEDMK